MRPFAPGWALLSAFLLLASPHPARSESGGPAELGPGEEITRRPSRTAKAVRVARARGLERAQRAELDSLSALIAGEPVLAGRLQREIEAAKRRHARESLALQREFALGAGDAALARRLEARITKLTALEGGAR